MLPFRLPVCWHCSKSVKPLPFCSATHTLQMHEVKQVTCTQTPSQSSMKCMVSGEVQSSWAYWCLNFTWCTAWNDFSSLQGLDFFEQVVLLICKHIVLFRKVNSKYISIWFSGMGRKRLKPAFCVVLGFYIGLCMWKRLRIRSFILV